MLVLEVSVGVPGRPTGRRRPLREIRSLIQFPMNSVLFTLLARLLRFCLLQVNCLLISHRQQSGKRQIHGKHAKSRVLANSFAVHGRVSSFSNSSCRSRPRRSRRRAFFVLHTSKVRNFTQIAITFALAFVFLSSVGT